MGGRRSGSLVNLVGKSKAISKNKGKLTKAISSRDPEAIAEASTRLITSSKVGIDSIRLSLKFLPYLEKNAKKLKKQSKKERDESIRKAWSKIKSKEGIASSRELDSAVISAAKAAIESVGGERK